MATLGVGEWSVSGPSRFTPGTHRIGCRVGPRASMDAVLVKVNVKFSLCLIKHHAMMTY